MSADIERAAEIAGRAIACRNFQFPCQRDCTCMEDARGLVEALVRAGYQLIPPVSGKVS